MMPLYRGWRWLQQKAVEGPLVSVFWAVIGVLILVLHAALVVKDFMGATNAIILVLGLFCLILLIREGRSHRGHARLRDFMYKLHEATEEQAWSTAEDMHYTYYVEADRNDRIVRRLRLTPRDHALVWHKIVFGVRGEAPGTASLDALRVTCQADQGEAWCLPVSEDSRRVEAVVFFVPPIPIGETRVLTVSGVWTGTWDPLRREGLDNGICGIFHDSVESLTIEVIFPRDYSNPRFVSRNPRLGMEEVFPAEGDRVGLRWRIDKPQKGQFGYSVRADRPM
jgi:hypothetical protein